MHKDTITIEPSRRAMQQLILVAGTCILLTPVYAAEITVAKTGGDYTTIQAALDNVGAGDTISVRAGTYAERLYIEKSGTPASRIVLQAQAGEAVYISGGAKAKASDPHMLYMQNQSYITVSGFSICSNKNGSGIFIEGSGNEIVISSNRIYEMRGTHGMGITVYGTEIAAIAGIQIRGNEIFDCEPATSEALTLNGNVNGFVVEGNYVHDVNNIGIDFIGGETDIHGTLGARNGRCSGNRVERARSSYGGGYAAGIYVDGGRNIILEKNSVSYSDMGIELGAENSGWNTTNITVRSNLLYLNDKVGIVFGGYDSSAGRVRNCSILNNTLVRNNRLGISGGDFHGECIVQYAGNTIIENNLIFVDERGDRRAVSEEAAAGNSNNRLDYNLYYCSAGLQLIQFQWMGGAYTGFSTYTNSVTGVEEHSYGTDPGLENSSGLDFHLTSDSAAIESGNPAYLPGISVTDYEGNPRVLNGRVDIGAYEYVPEPGTFLTGVLLTVLLVSFKQRRNR